MKAIQPDLFARVPAPSPVVAAGLDVFVRRRCYLLDERIGAAVDLAGAAALVATAVGATDVQFEGSARRWWTARPGRIEEWTATAGGAAVGYVAPSGRYAAALGV